MNIGIIGSGNIGATSAKLFARAGHEVAVSNSRGPESLRDLSDEAGANVRAATVEEATDFGDVILVAIPFFARDTLPAENLNDKVVIDATNYYPGRDGEVDFAGMTSSELLAHGIPGARLVKSFNTMYYETLATGGRAEDGDRLVLFVAGDDEEVKATVSGLIEEIGFAPVDTGSLRDGGRKQQPGSPIYNNPMAEDQAHEALAEIE
ncbi:MAG: NADPH-dependent F420 reductase [Rubrobacteraceae bacterium]